MRRYRCFIILIVTLSLILVGVLWAKEQYVVPIIMYHSIDENAAVTKLSVSPESFERQMYFLKKGNYNIARLEDLPDLMKNEKIPNKTIVITFDDGLENNYTYAFPVLKKLGIHATVFISPGLVGKEGYLTWGQVVQMSESGVISIGSHSMAHAYLPGSTEQKLDIEISDSKRAIESHIRKEIYSFCYPVGGFNDYVRDKVKDSGYRIAVATNPGKDYPDHDEFAMKRIRISRTSDSLLTFWIETSGFYTWIKEHRDED